MARGKRRRSTDGHASPSRSPTRSPSRNKRLNANAESSAVAAPYTEPDFLQHIACELRRRLTGIDTPTTTRGYDTERQILTGILTASIVRGESNSAVVIGGRGAGKTTLVEGALAAAAAADGAADRGHRVVRLNGLAHADDATAVRELARQMHVSLPASESDSAPGREGASAATAPDDVDAPENDEEGKDGSGLDPSRVSTGELVQSLLAGLKAGSRDVSQCLVILLEEFDLFAHAGKQSLLYTLLDAVQAGHTPLVVIGLTCRFDAEDLLEKRVLSRFSRRKFYLSKPLPFDEYKMAFEEALTASAATVSKFPDDSARWNDSVKELVQSGAVVRELRELYDTNGRDFRALNQLAMLAVYKLSADHPFPSAASLYAATVRQRADSKTNMMLSTSLLEMCLLIAMNNLALDHPNQAANFELTYKAYSDLVTASRKSSTGDASGKAYSKAVAFKAFEHLADLELVKFAAGSTGTPPTFRTVHLMLESEQIADALKRCTSLPTHMRAWLRVR
eukprot:m.180946 g.180946  ORF g.180946 m.180946 type:complete len:509 (+) comp15147_c0_seq1:65-1591(+)